MNPNTTTLADAWDRLYYQNKIDYSTWLQGPSLDALDRARPEGWKWSVMTDIDGFVGFGVTEPDNAPPSKWPNTGSIKAPDRLTCEARLVVAMWMAEKA